MRQGMAKRPPEPAIASFVSRSCRSPQAASSPPGAISASIGADGSPTSMAIDTANGRCHLVQRVAQILHLIIAGVTGDQPDDLKRRAGQAKFAREQFDIGGERLWARRGFGRATQNRR